MGGTGGNSNPKFTGFDDVTVSKSLHDVTVCKSLLVEGTDVTVCRSLHVEIGSTDWVPLTDIGFVGVGGGGMDNSPLTTDGVGGFGHWSMEGG